jgi:hypothetical protein
MAYHTYGSWRRTMARKKIWAYAYKGNREYIKNKTMDKERLFYIWEVMKMRRENPEELSLLTFMSTQSNKNKRSELVDVKTSKSAFFRYKSRPATDTEPQHSDSDLMSHEIAILVLSEMQTIKFQDKDKIYEIEFDKIKKDDLNIRFENGATYIPDLMGFFKKPESLARKWGGKVAIEVKVTHACEDIKIKDFYDHNIPIIEVSLGSKMRLWSELKNADINDNEMERHYHFLHQKFSNVVYMKILSDPIMPNEARVLISSIKKEVTELKNTIQNYQNRLQTQSTQNKEHLEKIDSLEKKNTTQYQTIHASLDSALEKNRILEEKVQQLKKVDYTQLSLTEKLKKLFQYNA